MMRPMKLAGSQLMFGEGCLEFLAQLDTKRASLVIGGHSMEKSGILDKVVKILEENKVEVSIIRDVEPDPSFKTVITGAKKMLEFEPDTIIALGGGSVMDAAKTMWVYYEHPELKTLEDILPPNDFPKLHIKAKFVCIPSTAGTASEVSRSVVISDENGMKHGIGNMEMMPDVAICDPLVTLSMPLATTADTGLDALTHALEAFASTRANYLSDILATQSAIDIINTLPKVFKNRNDVKLREIMLNASMVAGLAFTNVSLGIVHSMAHTVGSYFHVPHGLANAIILPYIIEFNSQNEVAKNKYDDFVKQLGKDKPLQNIIRDLNSQLNIPSNFSSVIKDRSLYLEKLDEMAECAKSDGCTKTNPIIPTIEQFKELFLLIFPEKGEC
ncbi:MAG: iron-containing alcohol dehydrogenase [Spirochaetia bacterium]|nr:iron-containing alcohol dehydrogenase [Spirochaetia bacterium]